MYVNGLLLRGVKSLGLSMAILLCMVLLLAPQVSADVPPGFPVLTTENPKGNSFGLEGKISAPAPTEGARITTPSGGQNYSVIPITVSGICPDNLLVVVLDNDVMSGSTMCQNGSFTVQIALFPGDNVLTAQVFDDLGQEGPESNAVTVSYSTGGNASFSAFGAVITLTSSFSRRAADPGSELTWPLQLSGGTGPYAFSIDWGDGSTAQLLSQPAAGIVNIKHTYKSPGIYRVTVKVTDVNGATGFLQVIAVANGAASNAIKSNDKEPTKTIIQYKVLWIPAAVVTILLLPAFWLGRRSEARAMRKRLEHEAEMISQLDQ